jgi:hypothetical protein
MLKSSGKRLSFSDSANPDGKMQNNMIATAKAIGWGIVFALRKFFVGRRDACPTIKPRDMVKLGVGFIGVAGSFVGISGLVDSNWLGAIRKSRKSFGLTYSYGDRTFGCAFIFPLDIVEL